MKLPTYKEALEAIASGEGDAQVIARQTLDRGRAGPRILAVCRGRDWADAGVDHVTVPMDADIDEEYYAYQRWLSKDSQRDFLTFAQWLARRAGAEDESDIVEQWHQY